MRIEPAEISTRLASMLRDKAGRSDLIESGFDIDDSAMSGSLALCSDPDVAIYHALFDRGASHAAVISPIPAPSSGAVSDEVLKWVAAKQAETAILDRAALEAATERVVAVHVRAASESDVRHGVLLECIGDIHEVIEHIETEHSQRHAASEAALMERFESENIAQVGFANLAEAREQVREKHQWIRFGVNVLLLLVLIALLAIKAHAQNVVQGIGTAGVPRGNILSVQGVASGTAIPVSGTVAITPPATWPLPTNAAQETGGNLATIAAGLTASRFQDNIAQINGATPLMGAGNTGTGSLRVTIATDQVAVAVSQASVPYPTGIGTVVSGQQAVTASAVVLPTNSCKTVTVKALIGNGVNIFIGPSGVSITTGLELAPGDFMTLPLTNSNLLYTIAASTGSSLSYICAN